MKDTLPEMRRLQFQVIDGLGIDRRFELAAEMFMAAQNDMRAKLPSHLVESEILRRVYRNTYNVDLPDDFFKEVD
ncbi:MAG: hypothetical protein WKF34_12115 [Pyrinomonadaceae bacterium]